MISRTALLERLSTAVVEAGDSTEAVERLCAACVEPLGVDAASLSFVLGGVQQGLLGSSSGLGRLVYELEHTFGEGPIVETAATRAAVVIDDMEDVDGRSWPELASEISIAGIGSILALPVRGAPGIVGVLTLVRRGRGGLRDDESEGAALVARFASGPLMDLVSSMAAVDPSDEREGARSRNRPDALDRAVVQQAVGMIIEVSGRGSSEALLRLRGSAIARGTTASALAQQIVRRTVVLDADDWIDESGVERG